MNNIRILMDKNIAIVTAYDDIKSMNRLKIISSDLEYKQFKVLRFYFDLFFFNGFSFNRFAAIDFDGKKFLKKTIQTFSHIEPSLEAQQNELILKNKDMVKQSVLSSKEVDSLYI